MAEHEATAQGTQENASIGSQLSSMFERIKDLITQEGPTSLTALKLRLERVTSLMVIDAETRKAVSAWDATGGHTEGHAELEALGAERKKSLEAEARKCRTGLFLLFPTLLVAPCALFVKYMNWSWAAPWEPSAVVLGIIAFKMMQLFLNHRQAVAVFSAGKNAPHENKKRAPRRTRTFSRGQIGAGIILATLSIACWVMSWISWSVAMALLAYPTWLVAQPIAQFAIEYARRPMSLPWLAAYLETFHPNRFAKFEYIMLFMLPIALAFGRLP